MKAFLLHGATDLRLTDLPVPDPKPDEVLIAVRRAGICGSDMHYYGHFRIGTFVPKRPFVLGHEFAGEIVAVGSGVLGTRVGERVTVDPSMPCGLCTDCRCGRYNLCSEMRFYGSASCDPHINGGFEEFVIAPAANCLAVPDSLDWGQAALIEPLSVAVHAVRRAATVAGKTVLITGGGTIGQLTAMVARSFGAARVVLSDIAAGPRAVALAHGADGVLDATEADFLHHAKVLVPGGFDVVIEAAGSAKALEQGMHAVRRGGTVVQVGTLPASVTLPLNLVMARELSLFGSFRFANAFQISIDLLANGRIKASSLITAVYPLTDLPVAIEAAIHDRSNVKVQISP